LIFLTVGMHHQGFDRLVRAMDQAAASLEETVVMQIGASSYEPQHAQWFRFAEQAEIDRLVAEARINVGHAGIGTVLTAFRCQTPLILVPRRAGQKEHVDDHQLELAYSLAESGRIVLVDEPEPEALLQAIEKAALLDMPVLGPNGLAQAVRGILEQSHSTQARKPQAS
jgi:beta-1,4-N-acetylglucosaminyltransferase